MRTKRAPYSWRTLAGLLFLVPSCWGSFAEAQVQHSQVLKIPDPAPRELSPELRYHNDSNVPAATQQLIAAQNVKRWQLIMWATDELVVLSERAEKAAQGPPGDASKKEFSGNVTKIESLAKNLTTALKANR